MRKQTSGGGVEDVGGIVVKASRQAEACGDDIGFFKYEIRIRSLSVTCGDDKVHI
jgi:hypothetical protein